MLKMMQGERKLGQQGQREDELSDCGSTCERLTPFGDPAFAIGSVVHHWPLATLCLEIALLQYNDDLQKEVPCGKRCLLARLIEGGTRQVKHCSDLARTRDLQADREPRLPTIRSIFAAMMKSFLCSLLIFLVWSETVA